MNTLTQLNQNVKADQMRSIATKNPTTRALLLYLAVTNNQSEFLDVPFITTELRNRGIDVDEEQLLDAFQELEELDLGVLIRQKDDVHIFRRNYNLAAHAYRAFPNGYVQQYDSADRLTDPEFKFQQTREEIMQIHKESMGKRGRPVGYSPKLRRFMSPAQMAARQAKKAKLVKRGKVGRPKGWSHKYGRFMTPAEIAAKKMKGPVGRPAGYSPKRKPGRPPKQVKISRNTKFISPQLQMALPDNAPIMPYMTSGRILTLPLGDDRMIRIELPKTLTKDDIALINLNLEHLAKNN